MKQLCFAMAIVMFGLYTSVYAEYVQLKGGTYFSDVKIVSIDKNEIVFMKNGEKISFSMDVIEKISAEAPATGVEITVGQPGTSSPVEKTGESENTIAPIRLLSPDEELHFETGFFSGKYYMGKNLMDQETVKDVLQAFPEALQSYQRGNAAGWFGTGLEIASVCMIAYPAVEYFRDIKYPNWTWAAMGVTLLMPSLFIKDGAKKHYQKAAMTYNRQKAEATSTQSEGPEWYWSPVSIGVSWNF